MRSHETLIDVVFLRQPESDDTSREAGVLRDIIQAHYEHGTKGNPFAERVIEIIEDAYVFAELDGDTE